MKNLDACTPGQFGLWGLHGLELPRIRLLPADHNQVFSDVMAFDADPGFISWNHAGQGRPSVGAGTIRFGKLFHRAGGQTRFGPDFSPGRGQDTGTVRWLCSVIEFWTQQFRLRPECAGKKHHAERNKPHRRWCRAAGVQLWDAGGHGAGFLDADHDGAVDPARSRSAGKAGCAPVPQVGQTKARCHPRPCRGGLEFARAPA